VRLDDRSAGWKVADAQRETRYIPGAIARALLLVGPPLATMFVVQALRGDLSPSYVALTLLTGSGVSGLLALAFSGSVESRGRDPDGR
jgi:hypothetical protein